MKLRVKRFDADLPLPQYKTAGAVAMDLAARETITIPPHAVGYVPLNIALQLPHGTWALMAARSSLHKRGVIMANGIGVGDEDFCGNDDEYRAALLNYTDGTVVIERGERIVQLMILRHEKVDVEEVQQLAGENRGGFGTTGRKG